MGVGSLPEPFVFLEEQQGTGDASVCWGQAVTHPGYCRGRRSSLTPRGMAASRGEPGVQGQTRRTSFCTVCFPRTALPRGGGTSHLPRTNRRPRTPSKHRLAPALTLPLKVTQPERCFPCVWRKTHHVTIQTALTL